MADLSGPLSLQQDVNKVKGTKNLDDQDGIISSKLDELELPMSDEALLKLKKGWELEWSKALAKLKNRRERNEKYWLGRAFLDTEQQIKNEPVEDNEVFEAVETFLPAATAKNPEAMVYSDNTPEGISISGKVSKMLEYLADRNTLKLQITQATRHWLLYFQGAVKIGYDLIENEIVSHPVRPQRLILDANATVEGGKYTGEFIGEYRRDTASVLIDRFPQKKELISAFVDGKMGTKVQYLEWWTDEYVFWTLKDAVLGKSKNPHWNYPTVEEQVDEFGAVSHSEIQGRNHFACPRKPYVLLSVFNVGKTPYDETSLVEQSLSTQERISKRYKQIDRNADNTNGGLVLSGRAFTREQAANATDALRRGAAILVPNGDINNAYRRDMASPLPATVYNDLVDSRNKLKQVFGVSGLTPQGAQQDRTVRGKLIIRGQDTDRIGGGVGAYLEQFADGIFNWYVQMMMVYYDEPHVASIIGQDKAVEYIQLASADIDRKLTVTVRENSLIPKDSMTKRQEAIDLWSANALDPISLYSALDFPNPREQAKNLFLWQNNPQSLFPDLAPPAPAAPPAPPAPPAPQPQMGAPPGPSDQMLKQVPIA